MARSCAWLAGSAALAVVAGCSSSDSGEGAPAPVTAADAAADSAQTEQQIQVTPLNTDLGDLSCLPGSPLKPPHVNDPAHPREVLKVKNPGTVPLTYRIEVKGNESGWWHDEIVVGGKSGPCSTRLASCELAPGDEALVTAYWGATCREDNVERLLDFTVSAPAVAKFTPVTVHAAGKTVFPTGSFGVTELLFAPQDFASPVALNPCGIESKASKPLTVTNASRYPALVSMIVSAGPGFDVGSGTDVERFGLQVAGNNNYGQELAPGESTTLCAYILENAQAPTGPYETYVAGIPYGVSADSLEDYPSVAVKVVF